MKRTATDTFVVDLPLVVAPAEDRKLMVSFEAGRRLYNACLGEGLRRLDAMRRSEPWRKARALPKTVGKKSNPQRRRMFKLAQHAFGFTSASVSAFGTQCKNEAHWQDRLGAHETQRVAERAFAAVEAYAFGKRGRPRFKGKNRPLHSLESKTNAAGIRWHASSETVQFQGLALRAMVPSTAKDRHGYVQEALSCRAKFCRLVWRTIKGKRRWFVQLVLEGKPPRKYETVSGGIVGVDVGPSTIAVFGDEAAALAQLAPSVEQPWTTVRRLQRSLARSRRATNPECFNVDGTWKRGAKIKVRSGRYEAWRNELAEAERVLAERRKRDHGHLCNRILAQGNIIQGEKLSYKAFQGAFGRSVKVRAPGALIAQLTRKAESAGGQFVELDTRALRLSQFDHTTSTYTKKPLSQRWHVLGGGSGVVQRDIYSAFLARQAMPSGDATCPSRAFGDLIEAWAAANSLLRRAGWVRNECASVEGVLSTAPALPAPERIARRRGLVQGHSAGAVGLRDPLGDALRTPCL
jgi:hypothetical protein